MEGPFTSTFTNAPAIVVDDTTPLPEALGSMGLRPPYLTLAIVGGVNIDNAHLASLRSLFFNVLAPLAQACQAAVVDGGTNGGIMGFMDQARSDGYKHINETEPPSFQYISDLENRYDLLTSIERYSRVKLAI